MGGDAPARHSIWTARTLPEPENENWTHAALSPRHDAADRTRRAIACIFFIGVVVLLLVSVALVPLKLVRVKMLPFDNKSEFQVIVNMPDGTPLEQTTRVAQALGDVALRSSRRC